MGVLRLKLGALIGVLALLASAEPVLAQHQHKQKCEKAAKEAEEACRAAKNGAESKGNAHNSAGTAQDAGSGGNQNRGSENLCPRIQDQKNNLDNAKNTCTAAQAKCQKTCQDEKTQDDAHGQQFMTTKQPHPKEGVDPGVCNKELPSMISALASAAAPLAGQAQQACKSGEQSKGQMPQIPPITPPQKEEKKDEQKQQEQKQALQCNSSEGVRYSDCNSYYVGTCSSNLQASNCSEFAARYCGSAGGGSQTDVTVAGGKNAAVVVDKSGEGLGSAFCKTYSSYQFCQKTANQECPSCRGSYEYSSPTCQADPSKCIGSSLSAAQSKCPSDPMFMDPTVQKQIAEAQNSSKSSEYTAQSMATSAAANTAAGAAAASGGGSSSGLGGSTATGSGGYAGYGATPESSPAGTAVSMEHGDGGAGGSGGEGYNSTTENADGTRGPAGLNPQSAGSLPFKLPSDISYQYGPNVFAISTTVYRSMCTRGALTRCKQK